MLNVCTKSRIPESSIATPTKYESSTYMPTYKMSNVYYIPTYLIATYSVMCLCITTDAVTLIFIKLITVYIYTIC